MYEEDIDEIKFPNRILMFNLIRSCLGIDEIGNLLYNHTARLTERLPVYG